MATVMHKKLTFDEIKKHMQGLDEAELIAQQIALQSSIHALSFLLTKGCTEDIAAQMLTGLKLQSSIVNDEFKSRKVCSLFTADQTYFN